MSMPVYERREQVFAAVITGYDDDRVVIRYKDPDGVLVVTTKRVPPDFFRFGRPSYGDYYTRDMQGFVRWLPKALFELLWTITDVGNLLSQREPDATPAHDDTPEFQI